MKKVIINLLIIFPLFCFCQTNKNKTDLQKDNLFGDVEQIKQDEYSAKATFDGGVIQGGRLTYGSTRDNYLYNHVTKYNEKGNKVERTYRYDSNAKSVYTYDNKGNIIEENMTSINFVSKIMYRYDDKENKIKEGNESHYSLYKLDDKGNAIEKNDYKEDGSLTDKFTYRYDDKGNVIEKKDYRADGNLTDMVTFKYDDKGSIIQESWFNKDGSLQDVRDCSGKPFA